jgi:hypothetical protein
MSSFHPCAFAKGVSTAMRAFAFSAEYRLTSISLNIDAKATEARLNSLFEARMYGRGENVLNGG